MLNIIVIRSPFTFNVAQGTGSKYNSKTKKSNESTNINIKESKLSKNLLKLDDKTLNTKSKKEASFNLLKYQVESSDRRNAMINIASH